MILHNDSLIHLTANATLLRQPDVSIPRKSQQSLIGLLHHCEIQLAVHLPGLLIQPEDLPRELDPVQVERVPDLVFSLLQFYYLILDPPQLVGERFLHGGDGPVIAPEEWKVAAAAVHPAPRDVHVPAGVFYPLVHLHEKPQQVRAHRPVPPGHLPPPVLRLVGALSLIYRRTELDLVVDDVEYLGVGVPAAEEVVPVVQLGGGELGDEGEGDALAALAPLGGHPRAWLSPDAQGNLPPSFVQQIRNGLRGPFPACRRFAPRPRKNDWRGGGQQFFPRGR
mmetsp:Transcript_8251/g.17824  ORF Transcript_8251/g.17824 Transcript_8251/m.17824 type:complete len:280 (+) Transcript_8251:1714-2553(+)